MEEMSRNWTIDKVYSSMCKLSKVKLNSLARNKENARKYLKNTFGINENFIVTYVVHTAQRILREKGWF